MICKPEPNSSGINSPFSIIANILWHATEFLIFKRQEVVEFQDSAIWIIFIWIILISVSIHQADKTDK